MDDLVKRLQEHDPDKIEEWIEEYKSMIGEKGLQQFMEKKLTAESKEEKKTTSIEDLKRAYDTEIEAASRNRAGAAKIANIKLKYRRQGLNVW